MYQKCRAHFPRFFLNILYLIYNFREFYILFNLELYMYGKKREYFNTHTLIHIISLKSN